MKNFPNQKELNVVIGRNVEALRQKTSFSKAEFLNIIGINKDMKFPETYYNKLARGEVGYSLFTLLIIRRTFTVTLDELIS